MHIYPFLRKKTQTMLINYQVIFGIILWHQKYGFIVPQVRRCLETNMTNMTRQIQDGLIRSCRLKM